MSVSTALALTAGVALVCAAIFSLLTESTYFNHRVAGALAWASGVAALLLVLAAIWTSVG